MHFYYIDPHSGIIERILGKPSSSQIYELLNCGRIDFFKPNAKFEDGFYLDDEGFHTENTSANLVRSAWDHQPNSYIKGRMLFVGTDYKGDIISPMSTFIYDWENEDRLGRYLFANPSLQASCRISRSVEDVYGSSITGKYTMKTTHAEGMGTVPITKTLEDKLEELRTQFTTNQD